MCVIHSSSVHAHCRVTNIQLARFHFQEVNQEQMDYNSAYLLFYQRQTLHPSAFMPDISGREPDLGEGEDEAESELKKMCRLQ